MSCAAVRFPEEKLTAVSRWLESNLRYDPNCAYEWRDFERIVDDGRYGGCADHSLVFGALTRACGIPSTAQAYALNMTVVPFGTLGFLSAWPAGLPQPGSSTLNAPTGAITANAAYSSTAIS